MEGVRDALVHAVRDALVQAALSSLWGAVTNLLKEKKDYILNAEGDLKKDYILNAEGDLKKLQRKLKIFQVAIEDAECKPFFSKERNIDKELELKAVLYDAEDIIEEYQSEIEASKRDQVRKRSWATAFTSFYEDVSSHDELGKKIKKINERLDEIKKDWDMVDRLKTAPKGGGEDSVHGKHDNSRETTHHMGVQPPTGRKDDKREIVKRLLSEESAHSSLSKKGSVSIISIVGKGGIGKTTLAKMVFNEIEQQFGERRWWVCVSEKPNREDLLRKILKEVCKESKEYNNMKLSELCKELQEELRKGKFLLVLDDVWELQWWEDEVKGTLMGGAMRSKILITSRNEDVSFGMHASYMHELLEFNFQHSWDLFLEEALSDSQTEQDLVKHNVRDVGESIVKKCGGLPLVIKTVGSMMRTKQMSREDWQFVEDSKIWEWKMPTASTSSSEIGGHILPGLILSYDDLPYYLKSCFVYCCIYPKDYEIERERLIMQWVAHGLIEEKKHIDLEATANQYIQDLIRRCLIEENNKSYYASPRLKLHDILHDLASYVGGEEYSHASASQCTRHMSLLRVDNVEETMHNAIATTHKLRTLLADYNSYFQVYIEHLTNFKWLRVLSLRGCQMDELPKSIEDLALLKYLDLSDSKVRRLPNSIRRLCNLQMLDLSFSRIEELPKEMGELCNLRYLGLKCTEKVKFIAEGLGKLTNLRTLHRFLVCDDKEDTKGCDIRELKDLKKLKGELSIEGLGRSRKAIDHVGNPKLLKEKHGIISLELNFGITDGDDKQSGTSEQIDDEQSDAFEQSGVLDALEPPVGLECLKIRHYKGKMPAWHLKTECYTMLQTLELERCPLLEKLKSITSLKVLNVIDCPALCEIASMPALESLKVIKCGNLEQLPHHMPALKSLMVRSWNSMTMTALVNLPALESLEVSWCDSLEQLPHDMPALKSLKVSWCGSLEQLAHHMPALKSLTVERCNMLKTVADMPALKRLSLGDLNTLKWLPSRLPLLEELNMRDLANWEGWPAGGSRETTFTSMPCLKEVDFYECPKMQTEGLIYALSELAGHDSQGTQLQRLTVLDCPSARLGWKLLEQLPNLTYLWLDSKSAALLPSPLPSEVSTFLPSLKTLELSDYTDVDELSDYTNVVDEEVKWGRVPEWVWGLSQLEDLSLLGFTEDISLGGHWQCLPNLRYLYLYNFPNLKSLVDVNHITHQQNETTCPTDAQQQIACLSNLQSLSIHKCPALHLPEELTCFKTVTD